MSYCRNTYRLDISFLQTFRFCRPFAINSVYLLPALSAPTRAPESTGIVNKYYNLTLKALNCIHFCFLQCLHCAEITVLDSPIPRCHSECVFCGNICTGLDQDLKCS